MWMVIWLVMTIAAEVFFSSVVYRTRVVLIVSRIWTVRGTVKGIGNVGGIDNSVIVSSTGSVTAMLGFLVHALLKDLVHKAISDTLSTGANVKRHEQETEEKIHHLKYEAATISDDVVAMVLKHVTTVKN
ncbi:hypothetical protein VNO78_16084 [Psophocarpus tetragonolobus]|uniref:Uncharacterized protein n=1 Tax=Psophocarpus tetragonolobus TaxID=3891 RepID=A0AAN9SG37_PSOTE